MRRTTVSVLLAVALVVLLSAAPATVAESSDDDVEELLKAFEESDVDLEELAERIDDGDLDADDIDGVEQEDVDALLELYEDGDLDLDALADIDDEHLETVVEVYNNNVDAVPGVIADRIADERISLIIERDDGDAIEYTAVTGEDATVTSLEKGSEDPTIVLTVEETAIENVSAADDSAAAAVDAYEAGEIDAEGVGVANTVIVEATKLGLDVATAFDLL